MALWNTTRFLLVWRSLEKLLWSLILIVWHVSYICILILVLKYELRNTKSILQLSLITTEANLWLYIILLGFLPSVKPISRSMTLYSWFSLWMPQWWGSCVVSTEGSCLWSSRPLSPACTVPTSYCVCGRPIALGLLCTHSQIFSRRASSGTSPHNSATNSWTWLVCGGIWSSWSPWGAWNPGTYRTAFLASRLYGQDSWPSIG